MNARTLRVASLLVLCAVVSLGGTASGAVVNLINSSGYGDSWDNGPDWSDGQPAQAGNDYHVGASPTGKSLRTPDNVNNPAFLGDSLTIHSTGTLGMKHKGNAAIPDLRLDGGSLSSWVGNRTMGFTGTLTVLSASTLNINSSGDSRRIVIASQLTGSGNLNVNGADANDYVSLTNATNTYTGNWTVSGGELRAQAAGSLGSGSITVNSNGALDVDYNLVIPGSTLYVNRGTADLAAGLTADALRVGYNQSATVTVAAGAVQVGSVATPGEILVGRRTVTGAGNYHGVLDLSGATLGATLTNFRIGYSSAGNNDEVASGVVTLGATNVIDAGEIMVGYSTSSHQTSAGMESTLHFGAANTLTVGSLTIGGRKTVANADIAAGGTLNLAGQSGGRADLFIGRNDLNTGTRAFGEIDLSGATRFDALLNDLILGQKTGGGNGRAVGRMTLADTNVIDANTITLGYSDNNGQTDGAHQQRLILGTANTIDVGMLTIGGRKSNARVAFAAGGTLDLGQTTPGVIRLGYNDLNTGSVAVGVLDTTGGTADVAATEMVLGHKSGGGSGSARGSYIVGNGTTNVAGNLHETGDGGTSAVTVLGTHDFTVGGSVAVDTFTVGLNGTGGAATFSGAAAQIGTATHKTDLIVGRRTADTGTTFQGTLDLSGLTTFTAWLDEMLVGTAIGGSGGQQGQPRGVVTLAATNVIDAREIYIGESPAVGLGGSNNRIVLGANNTITADTLVVGGNKSAIGKGSLVFGAGGGVLDLGTAGDRVDVYVGRQTVLTGGWAGGVLDMSGGTFNAYIDQLVVGTKPDIAGGTTDGVVTMADGAVDANTITLGERTTAGSSGSVRGTFNLAGGTLTAGSIVKGAGNGNNGGDEANFNFTGGVLHVGTFGFTLDQDGGTLAPGASIDTTYVLGDYHLNVGVLEIEINAWGDPGDASGDGWGNDFVDVTGNARLDSGLMPTLIDGYKASEGYWFDVLTAVDVNLLAGFGLTYPAGQGGAFESRVIPGGNGEILQVRFVPEPVTLAALLAGAAGLAGYMRRRRRA